MSGLPGVVIGGEELSETSPVNEAVTVHFATWGDISETPPTDLAAGNLQLLAEEFGTTLQPNFSRLGGTWGLPS